MNQTWRAGNDRRPLGHSPTASSEPLELTFLPPFRRGIRLSEISKPAAQSIARFTVVPIALLAAGPGRPATGSDGRCRQHCARRFLSELLIELVQVVCGCETTTREQAIEFRNGVH